MSRPKKMCSPVVKAAAFSSALWAAAASPVWMRTLAKLAPNRGSMTLRTAAGKGAPPVAFTWADAGAAAPGDGAAAAR